MNYGFHPEALEEFVEAAHRYEGKQAGLGTRFLANVDAAIQRVVGNPPGFPEIEADVRRCPTRVFPYAVLYTIEANFILVVAVMHVRRRPGYWRHRLES